MMKIKEFFSSFMEKNKQCEAHMNCVEYKQMQAYFNRSNDTCAKRIERNSARLKQSFDAKIKELESKYITLLESLDHQGCVKKSYSDK